MQSAIFSTKLFICTICCMFVTKCENMCTTLSNKVKNKKTKACIVTIKTKHKNKKIAAKTQKS